MAEVPFDPAKYGLKPAKPSGGFDPAKYGLKPITSSAPGSSPYNPLQESGLTIEERSALKSFGPWDTKSQIEWLKADPGKIKEKPETFNVLGIETSKLNKYDAIEYKPGHIAIRKFGDTGPWRVVDPDTGIFSEDLPQDILDIAGDVTSALLPGKKMLTSAASMALGRSAEQKLGEELYGFKYPEKGTEVALSGIAGGLAPPISKLIGGGPKIARGIKEEAKIANLAKASQREVSESAEELALKNEEIRALARQKGDISTAVKTTKAPVEEIIANMRGETALKQSQLLKDIQNLRSLTEEPISAERQAALKLKAAKETHRQEIKAEEKKFLQELAERKAAGKPIVSKQTEEIVNQIAKFEETGIPSSNLWGKLGLDALNPATGVSAKYTRIWPEFRQNLKTAFGPGVLSEIGSFSMDTRKDWFKRALKEWGPDELGKKFELFNSLMAEDIAKNPTYAALIKNANAENALKKIRAGIYEGSDRQILNELIEKIGATKAKPEYLKTAVEEYLQARKPSAIAKLEREKKIKGFIERRAEISGIRQKITSEKESLAKKIRDIKRNEPEIIQKIQQLFKERDVISSKSNRARALLNKYKSQLPEEEIRTTLEKWIGDIPGARLAERAFKTFRPKEGWFNYLKSELPPLKAVSPVTKLAADLMEKIGEHPELQKAALRELLD